VHHVAADASALSEQKVLAGMQANCRVQNVYHVAPLVVDPALRFQGERSKGGGRHQKERGTAAISETKCDKQRAYVAAAEPAPVAEIGAHCRDAAGRQGVARFREYGIRPCFVKDIDLFPAEMQYTKRKQDA
jgi:hypothetical protein